jgi:hypothetical protein
MMSSMRWRLAGSWLAMSGTRASACWGMNAK